MLYCDFLWRLFESTGSINVYLLYRKIFIQ
ncbi:MAG: YqzL family protein [Peptococcales bacterium]